MFVCACMRLDASECVSHKMSTCVYDFSLMEEGDKKKDPSLCLSVCSFVLLLTPLSTNRPIRYLAIKISQNLCVTHTHSQSCLRMCECVIKGCDSDVVAIYC